MIRVKPESNSTTSSYGGNSTCYRSTPSRPVKKKRKPVHVAKPASAKQIRESLKISKRDILIARRIVNNIRHK